MTISLTKFDADFLLRRLAEHRELQRREELQSIAQIFDEVGGALEVGERLTVGRGPQRIVCAGGIPSAVDETSAEERVRTRAAKRRKKLLGHDAPPDKRTAFSHGENEVQS